MAVKTKNNSINTAPNGKIPAIKVLKKKKTKKLRRLIINVFRA